MSKNENVTSTTAVAPAKDLHPIFQGDPWRHMKLIKRTYAKKSTDDEFLVWARRCRLEGIDPLKGESLLVIYSPNSEEKRAAVTIDTKRLWDRILRATPGFKGARCHAVYSKDTFRMSSQMDYPEHEWNETADRGTLLGAWAVIEIEGQIPFYGYYRLSEFGKTGAEGSMWAKYEAHMMKKVALMNITRQVCADRLGGSYDEAEFNIKNGLIIEAEAASEFPMPREPAAIEVEAGKRPGKKKGRSGPPPAKDTVEEMPQPPAAPANGKGLSVEVAPVVDNDLYAAAVKQYDEITDILREGAAAWLGSVGFTGPDSISTWDQLDEIRASWMERVD